MRTVCLERRKVNSDEERKERRMRDLILIQDKQMGEVIEYYYIIDGTEGETFINQDIGSTLFDFKEWNVNGAKIKLF